MQIKIRKMTMEDLKLIKKNLTSDFDNFWSYNILKQELDSNISSIFVAISEKEILGFIAIKTIINEIDLMNIVIKKTYRKHGIGSKLLAYIINYATLNNINSINLEVNYKNVAAISLYKKFLFKEIGIRKKYYNNSDDAIIMKLEINIDFLS